MSMFRNILMDTIRRLEVRGYLFRYHKAGDDRVRPTAGSDNADIHAENSRAVVSTVYGNTVKWNQLLASGRLVDMGLPSGTLWTTSNIDITQEDGFAASPFQYGCTMFSWGNTEGHNTPASGTTFDYNWGGVNAQEPWYDGQPYGETAGATLTASFNPDDTYDAARYNLGSLLKTPTSTQFKELLDNCDFVQADGTTVIDASVSDKRVTVNGVIGLYLKSKVNGNLIFFSASGNSNGRSWKNRGAGGYYWSASFYSALNARTLSFSRGGVLPQNNFNRCYGFAVRAVVTPSTTSEVGHDNHTFCLTSNHKNMVDLTALGYPNITTTTPTVAEVESWLSTNVGYQDYYPYDAGSLISFGGTAVKSVGFNQWTGATAKVLSGQEYYIGGTYTSLSYSDGTSIVPTNRLFTANKTDNVTITGGSTDTVLNLSCDKNGTYAPYWEDVVDLSFVPNIGFETFNIWDETHYLANSVLNQDGNNVNTSSGNFTIGTFDNKIPVLPNKDYNITLNNAVVGYKYACFFDDNGNNISRREGFNNIPIHTPNNAAYMLCSIGGYSSDIYTYNICINESVAGLNGMYLPYGTPYYLFPDGQLKSAGSVSDEVSATIAIKRIIGIDLGTINWLKTDNSTFYRNLPYGKYTGGNNGISNAIMSANYQLTTGSWERFNDKQYSVGSNVMSATTCGIAIRDTSYTDANIFKTAMSGVILYYELATPIELSLNHPMTYKVDKYSTEELVAPTSQTGAPTSSALNADIDYQYRS